MPSIGKIISGHNIKIIKGEEATPPCNCTLYDCVVDGKCQEKGVIYQCQVKQTENGATETYVGLTENSFKDRLTKHRRSINVQGYHKNSFSNYIWYLKRKNIKFELSWRILAKAKPFSTTSKSCELCTREIYFIMFEKKMSSLNKKHEFFGFCLHKSKYLIKNQ